MTSRHKPNYSYVEPVEHEEQIFDPKVEESLTTKANSHQQGGEDTLSRAATDEADAAKKLFQQVLNDYLKKRGVADNEQILPTKRILFFNITHQNTSNKKVELVKAAHSKLLELNSKQSLALLAQAILQEDLRIESDKQSAMYDNLSSGSDEPTFCLTDNWNFSQALEYYLANAEPGAGSTTRTYFSKFDLTLHPNPKGSNLYKAVWSLLDGNNSAGIALVPDARKCAAIIAAFHKRFKHIIENEDTFVSESEEKAESLKFCNLLICKTYDLLTRATNQTAVKFRQILINAFLLERHLRELVKPQAERCFPYFSKYVLPCQAFDDKTDECHQDTAPIPIIELGECKKELDGGPVAIGKLLNSDIYSNIDLTEIPKPPRKGLFSSGMTDLETFVRNTVADLDTYWSHKLQTADFSVSGPR